MENVQEKEGEQNQPPKRIKTQQTEGEDRISSLPDSLIIDEILSRLDSTKYAIRTGTLSKRWQHLWPSVSTLYFSHNTKNQSNSDFYLSVDKTLTQCHPQLKKLNKFQVCVAYDSRFESQLNNWIRFATNCNVQQLYLLLWIWEGEHQFVLKDDSFFINSHFTHLCLSDCIFNPTGPINWKNLVNLSISNGKLDKHLIANILDGSPLLDTLRLADCYGYRRLDISSKSVKNLVFSGYDAQQDEFDGLFDIIEINAPYILSLTIRDDLYLSKLLLRDVSSLVKANLDYKKYGHFDTTPKEEGEEMLKRFILNLRHVKELEVGITCYKVLSRLEAKGFIFPSNLKVLDVTSPLYSDSDSMQLGDSSDNDSSNGGDSFDNDLSSSDSVESIDSEKLMADNGYEDDEVN